MTNQLTNIILQKQREVSALNSLAKKQPEHVIAKILRGEVKQFSKKSLKRALRCDSLAVIAEIKRKSPSKGHLATIPDPIFLAKTYLDGGANAISILTDALFFGGSLDDLEQVSLFFRAQPHPILRKDFIIHEVQVAEAVMAGADAILCIVAVLGERTKTMVDHAKRMGIEALVEIQNENELEIALKSGAEIIGINNRNLTTMQLQVNFKQTVKLLESIPTHIISVAESGILEPKIAQDYYQAGFDAVLIGEALVKSTLPANFIRACRHV